MTPAAASPTPVMTATKHPDFVALATVAAPFLVLLVAVGVTTEWQYAYTLDDPYIHLALARGISNFHYGIHPSEFAAPSSSVLWPFLMAPFAPVPGFRLVPLCVNSVCLAGTLLTLQRLIAVRCAAGQFWSWVAAALVAFCLNVYGLVFTGMEHSLQVVLAASIASELVQRRVGVGLWVSLLALPLVRYEGLAISVPALCLLAAQGAATRTKALFTASFLAIALVSFSAFLASLGLGYLPSSVVAKHSATTAGSAFGLAKVIAQELRGNIHGVPTFTVFSIALVAGFAAWSTHRARVLCLLAAPAVLHLCFGRSGWFGRYEVAMLLYLLIVSVALMGEACGAGGGSRSAAPGLLETGTGGRARSTMLLPCALIFMWGTRHLWQATLLTPLAAANIQNQHVQMAIIVSEYLDRPVAVNDLGAVALSARRYVLDLWGLGSYEVLAHRRDPGNDPALWIRELMAARDVRHAVVYDYAFPRRPDHWIKVAALKLPGVKVTAASDMVSFYATCPASASEMAQAISRYTSANPTKASMVELVWSGPGG